MKTPKLIICVFAIVWMMAWQAYAEDAKPKQKVLFLSKSVGYTHDVVNRLKAAPVNDDRGIEHWTDLKTSAPLSYAEQVLTEIGASSGAFAVTCTQNSADITANNLKNYDAVFFYTCGDIGFSPEQKQALLDFVRGGKAFIGAHSATDTFHNWPEYGEMIGGYFDGHPWGQKVRIKIEDPKHPAVRGLGTSVEIIDEIYEFKDPWSRKTNHVLMSLDNSSVNTNTPEVHRADKDFGITWVRSYGKGRVFLTALGHRADVWSNPWYQKMLLQGICWAMHMPRNASLPKTQ